MCPDVSEIRLDGLKFSIQKIRTWTFKILVYNLFAIKLAEIECFQSEDGQRTAI